MKSLFKFFVGLTGLILCIGGGLGILNLILEKNQEVILKLMLFLVLFLIGILFFYGISKIE